MKRLCLAVLAGAAMAASSSGLPGANPSQDPGKSVPPDLAVETEIASHVSLPSALANVRQLVLLGPRTGGTASGDRAASAVASSLRAIGLTVEMVDDPPMRTHEESSWRVSLGSRPLASAWPWNFSPSLPLSTVRLLPALATGATGITRGGSIAADSAEAVKGAAVLVDGPLDDGVYYRMVPTGAVALLTDAPGDPNRYIDWAPIAELPGQGQAPGAIPVFGLSYHDGRILREAIDATRSDGSAPALVTLELSSKIGMGRPRTVIGTLPGAGARKDQLILVCAHGDSDSGGPGADDNASGVASLIEVARALSAAGAAGRLAPNRPTVQFIVWGAEYHSSKAWVRAHPDRLGRIMAVINYDETGTGAQRDAVYYEGNDVPWNEPLLRTLESVANDHAGQNGFPTSWTSNPSQGGTDAYVFLPKRYQGLGLTSLQIPATTVYSAAWDKPNRIKQTPGWKSRGWSESAVSPRPPESPSSPSSPTSDDLFIDYSAYYHSGGDTPANTTDAEPWNMERCAKLVVVGIYRLIENKQSGQPAESGGPGSPR